MEINLTLIVQMLVFGAFVWFTMKFVWPPLMKVLEERKDKIADGLAAAERGRRELELAQHRVIEDLKQAKADALDILDKANRRSAQLIDEAKMEARAEAQKVTKLAQEQLGQDVSRAKDELRKQIGVLAVAGAEKILKRAIDDKESQILMDNLIEEI